MIFSIIKQKWPHIRRSAALSRCTLTPTMAVIGDIPRFQANSQHQVTRSTPTQVTPYRKGLRLAYRLIASLCKLVLSFLSFLFVLLSAAVSHCAGVAYSLIQFVAQQFNATAQLATRTASAPHTIHTHHAHPHHKGRGAGKWQYLVYIVPTSTIM